MAERKAPSNTREAGGERSTEDIRQDIAKEEETLSKTVEQIGEHIKEKLDWREYVKDSPYWAIGVAAGLGYLAAGRLIKRPTPIEEIMNSIAEDVHDSLSGLRAATAGPGIVKLTMLGIATKAITSWIKKCNLDNCDKPRPRPQPQAEVVQLSAGELIGKELLNT
jgi:ElaB/YqjD/DUF883 family membrane-anchored ribosome-binding protein